MQEKGKAIEDKYNPKLKEKLEPVRKMKSAIKDKVQREKNIKITTMK